MDCPREVHLTAVIEEDDGLFVARALEFGLEGVGETMELALEALRGIAEVFLRLLIPGSGNAEQLISETAPLGCDRPNRPL